MKDFREFQQFFLADCKFEIKDMLNSLGDKANTVDLHNFTKEDYLQHMQLVADLVVGYSFLLLKRYYEWEHEFPDNPERFSQTPPEDKR